MNKIDLKPIVYQLHKLKRLRKLQLIIQVTGPHSLPRYIELAHNQKKSIRKKKSYRQLG